MNEVPSDLGPCDFVWSSCALEHLGSPEKGMEFALASARLLAPGGSARRIPPSSSSLAERRPPTGDISPATGRMIYAHCPVRLKAKASRSRSTLHVPMDRAEDRMVSLSLSHGPDLATVEPVHLKVALFESGRHFVRDRCCVVLNAGGQRERCARTPQRTGRLTWLTRSVTSGVP